MPELKDCPGTACCQVLTDPALSPVELERYTRHVESCRFCQEHLDRAAVCEDDLRRMADRLGDPTTVVAEPALVQAMESLLEGAGPDGSTLAESTELYFLQTTDQPGLLGMLGNYQVRRRIGEGGMGVVLEAYEPALHRLVAIKVLAPALAGSAVARRRFIREAKAAAAVCHDHIVAVHAVNEVEGLPYLVMQYVAGESLQARLDRTGALELTEIVRIALQTASGLAAAHAQGLIHRDIKPANLLLENGLARVKITDFGLARTTDDVGLTQQGVLAGTPEYMAPEQARGESIDPRADLFSLGSVLYAMCTGLTPFRGSTVHAVLRRVSEEEPVPIRTRNPEIPAWLEAFVSRLLAKDPADRFQSAGEVVALLEAYLAHLRQPSLVAAPVLPAPPLEELPEPPRSRGFVSSLRRPVATGGILLAVLVLIAAGIQWAGGLPQFGSDSSPQSASRLKGHTGPIHDVRFTRDGRLVSASGWPHGDRSVRIWDLASRREVGRIITPAEIHSLDLAPDGQFALVGLSDGQVLHLDLDARQVVRQLTGHTAGVDWVSFAPDGKHLFSAAADGTARMWNLANGNELARFRVQGKWARGGAVFPDSRRLLTGDDSGLLQVWDLSTKQEIERIPLGGPWMIDSMTLTQDGRQTLVAGVAGLRVIDLGTRKETRAFQAEHEETYHAALSPDGTRLLTASFDGGIRLWDFQSGKLLREMGSHKGFAFSVAFSPDGRFAASGGGGEHQGNGVVAGTDHEIRLWELTGVQGVPQQRGGVWLVAAGGFLGGVAVLVLAAWFFTRRGRHAANPNDSVEAGSADPGPEAAPTFVTVKCGGCGKRLRGKPTLAGKRVKCPGCGAEVQVPAGPASSPSIAAPSPQGVAPRRRGRWWIATGCVVVLAGLLCGRMFWRGPSGPRRSLVNVTVGNEVFAEVSETGFHCQEYDRGQPFRWTEGTARLVIPIDPASPPQALLVQLAAFRPGQVPGVGLEVLVNRQTQFKGSIPLGLWEQTFELQALPPGDQVSVELISDTFQPDAAGGKASGTTDDPRALGVQVRGIKLIRRDEEPVADRGRILTPQLQFRQDRPRKVFFGSLSADGQTLACGDWNGTIVIWDVPGRQERRQFPGLVPQLQCLAVSPDGRTVATGSADRVLRVWDLETGKLRHTLTGHRGQILALAYSPDGKTLASAGDDSVDGGDTRLWDLSREVERVTIPAQPFRVWALAYAPDGRSVAVTGGERVAQIFDTSTGELSTSLALPANGRFVAFSPEGQRVAVAHGQDGAVALFDRASGRCVSHLQTPGRKRIWGVAFSQDGKRLLTPCESGRAIHWDVGGIQPRIVGQLEGHEGQVSFALFHPEAESALTGGIDRTVRMWDLSEGR